MSLPIIKQNGDEIDVTFYLYQPSDVAAYAFIGLFGVCATSHVVLMCFYRSWHFIPLIIGNVRKFSSTTVVMLIQVVSLFHADVSPQVEGFAYYGRVLSHSDMKSMGAWALGSMLMYIAPVLLAATMYMALARIIIAIGAIEHSLISPRWLVKVFVLVDVIVFISQIAGIGLQATGSEDVMKSAEKAIAAGLAFQLVMVLFFGIIAIRVHMRCGRFAGEKSDGTLSDLRRKRTKYFIAVYIAALAIALRSLVRLIEYAQGPTGTIARYETFQYVFDAVPMLLLILGFLVAHPGRVIMQSRAYRSMISAASL